MNERSRSQFLSPVCRERYDCDCIFHIYSGLINMKCWFVNNHINQEHKKNILSYYYVTK